MKQSSPRSGSATDPISLSTGETIALPLVTHARVTGAVFEASLKQIEQVLPDGLIPVHSKPQQATVTVLCAGYHRIGSQEVLEPYNECTILIPAIPESAARLPYGSPFTRYTGGYVWYRSVTTESAKALNMEARGCSTQIGEITHTDTNSRRRTMVTVGNELLLTIEIDRPPVLNQTDSAANYTMTNDGLLQERLELTGEFGIWPAHKNISYRLGEHLQARRLQEIGLSQQALFRFTGTGEIAMDAGRPL